MKQEAFIRTMQEHPELEKHVCELYWTVFDLSHCSEDEWDDPVMAHEQGHQDTADNNNNKKFLADTRTDDFYYYYADTAAHDRRADALWQTFESLVNVSSVDICWLL